jgi:hypothetical protein
MTSAMQDGIKEECLRKVIVIDVTITPYQQRSALFLPTLANHGPEDRVWESKSGL